MNKEIETQNKVNELSSFKSVCKYLPDSNKHFWFITTTTSTISVPCQVCNAQGTLNVQSSDGQTLSFDCPNCIGSKKRYFTQKNPKIVGPAYVYSVDIHIGLNSDLKILYGLHTVDNITDVYYTEETSLFNSKEEAQKVIESLPNFPTVDSRLNINYGEEDE